MSRTQGMPAMSPAWGLWADAGMAGTLDAAVVSRVERTDVQPLRPLLRGPSTPARRPTVSRQRCCLRRRLEDVLASVAGSDRRRVAGRLPKLLVALDAEEVQHTSQRIEAATADEVFEPIDAELGTV